MSSLRELGITPETITAYDQRIPRYTSYPPAPAWTEEWSSDSWKHHLEATSTQSGDLSLYVHLPFCGKRCKFCACNVIITSRHDVANRYLESLMREMALVAALWRGTGKVIQLHFGGGTPNFFSIEQLRGIIERLRSLFPFSETAELSIEVDPRIATPDYVTALAADLSFSRISFGVQDFHAETQEAIGREQTEEVSFHNVKAARDAGISSVNIDLIYGLPMQTPESWEKTLISTVDLRPDRIALYNFAWLPGRLAHHREFDGETLPAPQEKLDMFVAAHEKLTEHGWDFIGMDHYALQSDSLSKALHAGSLRRNFMGYTTLRGTDLIGFGTSSISDFQNAFSQNVKKLNQYQDMVDAGVLPVERGLMLSEDDRVRRHAIEEVMCNGFIDAASAPGPVWALVDSSREELARLDSNGLVRLSTNRLEVLPKGRIFLRNIAVVFDAGMKSKGNVEFSRAI